MPRTFPSVTTKNAPLRPGIKKAAAKAFDAVTKPIKWAGKQIEKEMRMNEAKDKGYKKAGKALNRMYSK